MRARRFVAAVAVLVAVGALGASCGRSDLDINEETGAGGNGGGSGGSGGGAGGSGGGTGGPLISCGAMSCIGGAQICCVQSGNSASGHQCAAAGSTCVGAQVECVDDSACTPTGRLCCLSQTGAGTACLPASQCFVPASLVTFCSESRDCPASRPSCCPLRISPTGICAPAGVCP